MFPLYASEMAKAIGTETKMNRNQMTKMKWVNLFFSMVFSSCRRVPPLRWNSIKQDDLIRR
jgi:hypothetical protein